MLVASGTGLAQVCAPNAAVRPSAQITASLDASNCMLADGTWYTDYLVDFPSRGNWSAALASADGGPALTMVLRDQSGARIDSGPTINRTVERGTYHILVNSPAPNVGGNFTLTSSFSSVANILCRHFAMMGTVRSVTGSLGKGSCALPDGSAFDGYQLTLYGSGVVDLAITASGFTPLLILRTPDGHAVASSSVADDSGVVHLIVPEIGNDTYTVVATVASQDPASPGPPGGNYSLKATFTPDTDETCTGLAALTDSQQYSGSISTGSCNFNLPGREDAALFNYYDIHLDSTGVIQASIDTADFSSLLLLLDADGNAITDDIDSGGSGTPLIRQQLAPGDYRLILFNEDSFGGDYMLNYEYTPGPAPACTVAGIDSGSQATGILSGRTSCKDSIFLADVYKVVLPSDGTINLSLSSPDFSTFLDVHDGKDNDLTWGTQSSDGSVSVITLDLQAGTYYINVASMDMPGGYALSYTFTPKTLPACPAPRLMPPNGFIHNVELNSASCQGLDGRKADYYRFTLPAPSSEAIFMTSASILPEVTLYQKDGTPLRSDQNSYADGNAVIVQYLPAGDYTVRTRSADPTAEGLYNLDLLSVQGEPQLCAPRNLPLAGSVTGRTSFTSCAWYDKTFADVYQVTVSDSGQMLTVGAASGDFDSFLILLDAKGNVIASDDNSGGGGNALLVQTLDPGRYFVVVKPADDPTSAGSYTMITSMVSAPVVQAQPNLNTSKF